MNISSEPLVSLLAGSDQEGQSALDALWQSLPEQPGVCWYPSAGRCFRDLLVWRHYRGLAGVSEPDLYLHTDYLEGPAFDGYQDDRTWIEVVEAHELRLTRPLAYAVSPDYASLPGLANASAGVWMLRVRVKSKGRKEFIRPVLHFRFENFNWFECLVVQSGLRFSHLFKLREGCGCGGCRTSLSNLYPLLAGAGCRYLVADPEIHLNERAMCRLIGRAGEGLDRPFELEPLGRLGSLSNFEMRAFRIAPRSGVEREGDGDWIQAMFGAVARDSPWGLDPASI